MNTIVRPKGIVEIIINYDDGRVERREVVNTVLYKGREALANCLARNIGDSYQYYVESMLFGDEGTSGGVPKYVNVGRNRLFTNDPITKTVIATIDDNTPSQVVFTSVLTTEDANNRHLNEMALQMATGDLYSMTTFPDLTKTQYMQITWNWHISFV